MARHLIMGYYYCTAGHKHSSEREVDECNNMQQVKHIDEMAFAKENTENQRIESLTELEKVRLEQEKVNLEKKRLDHETDRLKHQETLAQIELAKLEVAKEREKNNKSRVCVLS